jgi:hypothetical protein
MTMDHTTPNDEVINTAIAELWRRMEMDEQIEVDIGFPTAMIVLQALQWGLRHGLFKDVGAALARSLARQLEAKLGVTPATAELIRRGWTPTFDEVRHG